MKAHELAKKLLECPNMRVGIRICGGDNRWAVNSVKIEEWDESCDSILLIDSEHHEKFIFIDAMGD
jgi:hypothetical protein